MTKIKAIDTEYKGYLFRSRLEARWAVFFDELGWLWDYEKEGFELKSGRYLPDFWFPELDAFGEIKAKGEVTRRDLDRIWELSDLYPVILFDGNPGEKSYKYFYKDGPIDCVPTAVGEKIYPLFYTDLFDERYFDRTVDAAIIAKQKRFEFLKY